MPRSIAKMLVLLAVLAVTPAAIAQSASLTVTFTNNGEPLEDPTHAKFYVYEVEERDTYLGWGHGAKAVRVPEGTYDVVIKYRNGEIYEERVLEELELAGDVEQEIGFNIPIARLTVQITSGGEPILVHTGRFSLYAASRRGKPLVSKRPGETVTIRPGSYDIEVVYRDHRGLQATWLEYYSLEGERFEAVDFGPPAALFRLTFLARGKSLPADRGRWRIFEPGQRLSPLAEGGSGDSVELPAGVYDVGLYYRHGQRRVERWLEGVELRGEVHREVEIAAATASVRVDVLHRGSRLSDAWYTVQPAGEGRTVLGSGMSGAVVEVEPGIYDIGCFYRNRGVRAEAWLRAQEVVGRLDRQVELDYRPASLRVLPKRRSRLVSNLLLVVDSSAGMSVKLGSRTKLEVAQLGIKAAMGSLRGADVRLAVRAYGITPASGENCRDSSLLLAPDEPNQSRVASTLDLLRPGGASPISYSLDLGSTDMPSDGRNTLVLLAGGIDGCGRNPCATASRLIRRGLVERIYVVGLGIPREQRRALSCIGEFYPVSGRAQLRSALQHIFREVTNNEHGTVSVFRPSGGEWIVSGVLGDTLQVAAGSYDLLIQSAGRSYSWTDVEISGEFESTAGPRP
jgi:hypothetical protein